MWKKQEHVTYISSSKLVEGPVKTIHRWISFEGMNGWGKWKIKKFKGMTIIAKKLEKDSEKLSNDNIVTATYKLSDGYIWKGNKDRRNFSLDVKVSNLGENLNQFTCQHKYTLKFPIFIKI